MDEEICESFRECYTRIPPDGFLPPSVAEEEEADRHVLLEILMFKGQGVDEAISSVICDRDAFRSLLVCVRRVVKPRDFDVERRKREGGSIELRPNKSSKESGDGARGSKAKKVCFNLKKGGYMQVWHLEVCAPPSTSEVVRTDLVRLDTDLGVRTDSVSLCTAVNVRAAAMSVDLDRTDSVSLVEGQVQLALFSEQEVCDLRAAVCDALGIDETWAEEGFELTPYKFNFLQALATEIGDIDVGLCHLLKHGASTGMRQRIPPSGF